jgi:hypothetical protein
MTSLVRDHGVQYLFAATILMGVFQIIAGLLKLGRLMRFVSQSVLTGFVRELSSNKPPPAPSSSRISLAWLERHRQVEGSRTVGAPA